VVQVIGSWGWQWRVFRSGTWTCETGDLSLTAKRCAIAKFFLQKLGEVLEFVLVCATTDVTEEPISRCGGVLALLHSHASVAGACLTKQRR
jgi:hypothetical protein